MRGLFYSYFYFLSEVGLYKHKNGHSWSVDDINVEEEIWDFFTKYIDSINTSISSQSLNSKRKIIKTVNLFGQEVRKIKNNFILNIYNDGYVEKTILVD